jgi:hypothetical protein
MPIAKATLAAVRLRPPEPWADEDVGVDPGEEDDTGEVVFPEGLPPYGQ